MSTLSALKLTAAKRSSGISPQLQRRLKLVKKIDDQIALAKALATGGTYTTSSFRTIKNEEGGSRSVEIQKKVEQKRKEKEKVEKTKPEDFYRQDLKDLRSQVEKSHAR